jgi:5-methylcytosine-specific restriction endonuclease McrA
MTYARLRQLVCVEEIAQWRKQNRAKLAAKQKIYLAANQERLRARIARYHKLHPYSVNRDKILAHNRAHPELKRAIEHRRQARKTGNGGAYSVADWLALCASWGNRCLCCGAAERLTTDHVIPVACGGRNVIENLQLLCNSCNCHKGTKTIDYRPGVTATRQGKLEL